jgi:hypothetical protein
MYVFFEVILHIFLFALPILNHLPLAYGSPLSKASETSSAILQLPRKLNTDSEMAQLSVGVLGFDWPYSLSISQTVYYQLTSTQKGTFLLSLAWEDELTYPQIRLYTNSAKKKAKFIQRHSFVDFEKEEEDEVFVEIRWNGGQGRLFLQVSRQGLYVVNAFKAASKIQISQKEDATTLSVLVVSPEGQGIDSFSAMIDYCGDSTFQAYYAEKTTIEEFYQGEVESKSTLELISGNDSTFLFKL